MHRLALPSAAKEYVYAGGYYNPREYGPVLYKQIVLPPRHAFSG
jgi:hypothetical protein